MTRLAITTRTQARKRRGNMTRLTDSDIANMLDDNTARLTGANRDACMTADEAVKLLVELRERRAADLSSEDRVALALAHNLAVTGALCRAFELGEERSDPWPDADGRFYPGCGRSAP